MHYKLQLIKERRLSTKIIVGKLRQHLPACLYNVVLALRYALFRKRCNNLSMPDIRYSDGAWTQRKTTADLQKIQDYLVNQPAPLRVLQIGIGNSSLFRCIGQQASCLVGITIAGEEIAYAKEIFPDDVGVKYDVRLVNKYSKDLISLGRDFDYIVDNDLSSYACCKYHFHDMLRAYHDMLKPGGAVLVGLRGLGYFDSGFGLSEGSIKTIAARHGLAFRRGDACYFLERQ